MRPARAEVLGDGWQGRDSRGRERIAFRLLAVLALIVVALLVGAANGVFHGRLPADTLPANQAQAEDVAYTVASDAGCGQFDSELPEYAPRSWEYECVVGDVLYRIYVYGTDQARAEGLARLQGEGRPYIAKAYYAVSAVPFAPSKDATLHATPPPASVMDPFR